MKKYIIYAGVNGAGKSTLYNINPDVDSVRVNTDEIVRTMGDWRDISLQARAGKEAVKLIHDCIYNGVSFNQESTLCGRSIINNVKAAKALGFYVSVYYVGVDSVKLAQERVKHRVSVGGHGIPDEIINKRYFESLKNLKEIIPLCDKIVVYDNTYDFQCIAEYYDGVLCRHYRDCKISWFAKYILGNK